MPTPTITQASEMVGVQLVNPFHFPIGQFTGMSLLFVVAIVFGILTLLNKRNKRTSFEINDIINEKDVAVQKSEELKNEVVELRHKMEVALGILDMIDEKQITPEISLLKKVLMKK